MRAADEKTKRPETKAARLAAWRRQRARLYRIEDELLADWKRAMEAAT